MKKNGTKNLKKKLRGKGEKYRVFGAAGAAHNDVRGLR
jgi:hypothetical protein